ncbi:hypothetical protein HDU86_007809 [Geranomyces michiganensis]|nr:hypothetical protein HDU86_007809 [Geranomyces michiganensis]
MTSKGEVIFVGCESGYSKLNGYRIETGQVDFWTLTVPGVKRSLCLVREDAAGTPTLVKSLDLGLGDAISSDCKILFADDYPHHIPVTAHDKVDSKRLKSLPLEATGCRPVRGQLVPKIQRKKRFTVYSSWWSSPLTCDMEMSLATRPSTRLRKWSTLARTAKVAIVSGNAVGSFNSPQSVLSGASLETPLDFPASCLQEQMFMAQKAMGDGCHIVGQLLIVDRALDGEVLAHAVALPPAAASDTADYVQNGRQRDGRAERNMAVPFDIETGPVIHHICTDE